MTHSKIIGTGSYLPKKLLQTKILSLLLTQMTLGYVLEQVLNNDILQQIMKWPVTWLLTLVSKR